MEKYYFTVVKHLLQIQNEIFLDEMACQDLLQQRRKVSIAAHWKLLNMGEEYKKVLKWDECEKSHLGAIKYECRLCRSL
jgi:hypothetical protein